MAERCARQDTPARRAAPVGPVGRGATGRARVRTTSSGGRARSIVRMSTFPEAVRALTDDALVAVLRARPDLAYPSPSTLRSLAARAASRTSLDRALARLDTPTLQVLGALVTLSRSGRAPGGTPSDDAGRPPLPTVTADDVAAAVGATTPDDAAAVDAVLARATAQALVWAPAPGAVAPAPGLDEVLDPVAPTPLPERWSPVPPAPVDPRPLPTAVVDAEAAGAAVEAVRLVDTLVRAWQDAPPPVLRSGGLGVRDVHRTARLLEVDDQVAATVIELAAGAGLVDDDGEDPPSYVLTTRADAWDEAGTAERWGMLATAWAGTRRTPWLAGTRDEKGALRPPLGTGLSRGWVPRLRTQILTALATLGPIGVRPADVCADLAWRSPRAVPPESAVTGLLAEAALLGVTGAGALATTGRTMLDLLDPDGASTSSPGGDAEAVLAATLTTILPEPVDDLLLQGDLTGVVPGRPSHELVRLIEDAAEVESRGAATTVRFTPASVTRALDAGTTADDLLATLSRVSRTPVPQALDYLVRDTARRHASLRVGAAGSYVRAADPAVLTGLAEDPRLAGLGLIRLAPTVLAAAVPAAAVQSALRGRGLAAALEGPDGQPLGRLAHPARIERGGARLLRAAYHAPGPASDAERLALVGQLRIADGGGRRSPFASTAGGTAGVSGPALARAALAAAGRTGPPSGPTPSAGAGTITPGDALALLRDAVRDGGHVWLHLVDGRGQPLRRRVRPLRLDAGRLRALDTQRGSELTVAVHRIAGVDPDDDPGD